jgi:parvulin-like peptidyl-prolyl isomerase
MSKKGSRRKQEEQVKRQTKKQLAVSRRDARQNRIIMLSLVGLAVVIVAVLAYGLIQELVVKPNRPVAVVNGTEIKADLYGDLVNYYRYNQYTTMANLQQGLQDLQNSGEDNEFLISFYQQQLDQMQAQLTTIPDAALETMIEDELIREKAEEEGIVVTVKEAQQTIDDELRQALSQPQETITGTETLPDPTPVPQSEVDDLYASILDNITISKGSFEEIRRRDLVRNELQELLASEVVTTGLVVHAQIIQTETEEEAIAAKERIEAGEEFSVVAQEVSTDTLTVDAGGDLGWVAEGQVSARYGQALEDAIFGLEPGEDVRTLQSGDLFYVVQVLERDENGPLPDEVVSQRQSAALTDWLQARESAPGVEIERLLEDDQIPPDPFTQTTQLYQ